MSEPRTRQAIQKCADWLHQCLSFGWKKSDLDMLEALWWQHHDYRGRLVKSEAAGAPTPSGAPIGGDPRATCERCANVRKFFPDAVCNDHLMRGRMSNAMGRAREIVARWRASCLIPVDGANTAPWGNLVCDIEAALSERSEAP